MDLWGTSGDTIPILTNRVMSPPFEKDIKAV